MTSWDRASKEWRYRNRDGRLVTGGGKYINDIKLPGMLYCALVLSKYPHAVIKRVDVDQALRAPGVVAVLTGEEVKRMMRPLPPNADYAPLGWHWRLAEAYPLAVGKARFVGEPVAAVAAIDEYRAFDAAELVEVEYEPLRAVASLEDALKRDAPLLYEEWGSNVQVHMTFKLGDVEGAFRSADRVVKTRWREARQSGFPLEPRGAIAYYDASSKKLTIWSSTQSPSIAQVQIAKALGLQSGDVKVYAPDVGGGFGNKLHWLLDMIASLLSIKTGRPVKIFETRYQNIISQPHQRDVLWEAEAAVKNDGKILALRAKLFIDLGVEGTNRGTGAPSIVPASLSTPAAYKIGAVEVDAYGVVTNKSFYDAYRGYGKDKGVKLMERLINRVSIELGIPPEDVRFKNFIQRDDFPYRQITGYVYDSGNYPEVLRRALEYVNIEHWRKRQLELRREGRYVGIGIAFVIEPGGGAIPYSIYTGYESARMRITPDGVVEVFSGWTEIGQGSLVSIARITSETLGVRIDDVRVFTGASDYMGAGPWASRGASYCAGAIVKAARELRRRLSEIAAHMWDARPEDVRLEQSELFLIQDPSKRVKLSELCNMLYHFPGQHRVLNEELLNKGLVPLDVTISWFSPITAKNPSATYTTTSCSADVAIVEVEVETGEVKILKYVTVHDAGRIIDHEVVEGQVTGGLAQAIGAALYEEVVYSSDGYPLTASFMDYLMPSSSEMPIDLEMLHVETPSPFTELGSKGMGEAPAYSGTVAIANAVEDALSPFGAEITEVPLKPERVLRALRGAT